MNETVTKDIVRTDAQEGGMTLSYCDGVEHRVVCLVEIVNKRGSDIRQIVAVLDVS